MLHHGDDGLVLLVVRRVQEDSLGPHLILLARSDEFRNHQFPLIGSNVIHQTFRCVFCIQNAQVSVYPIVSAF